jgi:hypothetical protein
MLSLWKCTLAASFYGAGVACADPFVFHTQTFSDQTTVTMALTSSSALSMQEYDFGVTINLVQMDGTGSVTFQDNGLHKALVQCHSQPGKIFVGGREYRIVPEGDAAPADAWKNDLWRAVCMQPPTS